MSRTRKYKRYSPEFKREALKRASEDDTTDNQVCEELGISACQLGRWRDEFRLLGNEAFPGQGHDTIRSKPPGGKEPAPTGLQGEGTEPSVGIGYYLYRYPTGLALFGHCDGPLFPSHCWLVNGPMDKQASSH